MKTALSRFKTFFIALSLSTFGIAVIVLADTLGGCYLPAWVYILIWAALFCLALYGKQSPIHEGGERR